jgi:hypothetical protein
MKFKVIFEVELHVLPDFEESSVYDALVQAGVAEDSIRVLEVVA